MYIKETHNRSYIKLIFSLKKYLPNVPHINPGLFFISVVARRVTEVWTEAEVWLLVSSSTTFDYGDDNTCSSQPHWQQMTPAEEHFNSDGGLEIPGWLGDRKGGEIVINL